MSSDDTKIKIKDSYTWLVPVISLVVMIIACIIAIIFLINSVFPGMFSQVDLNVDVSQKSMSSFSEKTDITLEDSFKNKSFSTHKYVCEGEKLHVALPITSSEFTSFVSYALPGDFPAKSTQIKFNDGNIEISSRVNINDFIEMLEDIDSAPVVTPVPQATYEPAVPFQTPDPNTAQVPTTQAPAKEENLTTEEKRVRDFINTLPDNVNIHIVSKGVIVDNKIEDLGVYTLNIMGVDFASVAGGQVVNDLSEMIINGFLKVVSEELNFSFSNAHFVDDQMIFTGTTPEKISMIEKWKTE